MIKINVYFRVAAFFLLQPLLLSPLTKAQPIQPNLPTLNISDTWYQQGEAKVIEASRRAYNNSPGAAKNIILFIGDGMSLSTITAARIYSGQRIGLNGESSELSFEKFPWTGLSKTYNTNQQTPDSAGTMTAIMTGIKTKAGVIGIDSQSQVGDCESYFSSLEPNLMTALELAEIAGKKTGIISTARITHATPAATYAKAASRGWESSANLTSSQKAMGCVDIAQQLIDFEQNLEVTVNQGKDHPNIDGIDVVFGGGRAQFFGEDPVSLNNFAEEPGEGKRDDGRNLIQEWVNTGNTYVMDQSGFNQLQQNNSNNNVLGLFNSSHMHYEADRPKDINGEPSLSEMTSKAIQLLNKDSDGFFLMVESGRIDHAHHANNAFNALNETVELSNAVAAAVANTDPNETLIIVTADHSHVMSMGGYNTIGNPILGKVRGNDRFGNPNETLALDREGMPYTTITYANGAGFAQYGNETDADHTQSNFTPNAGRHDLTEVNTQAPGYHQETLVSLAGETHAGEDVAIYGSGPGAHLLSGSLEQNVIFHVMNFAGDLENKALNALNKN